VYTLKKQIILVSTYLVAIISANLIVNYFGKAAVLPVGFCLVGFDITTRDLLHEVWVKNRWLKLGCLIAVGSLLSWVLNRSSGQIALASFIAFASAGILDTLTYAVLRNKAYLVKVNGSNLVSSLADSTLFLTIAFGFIPLLIIEQFAVKFVGGFIWSLVLHKRYVLKGTVAEQSVK
jgi:queuosine precursor transporter